MPPLYKDAVIDNIRTQLGILQQQLAYLTQDIPTGAQIGEPAGSKEPTPRVVQETEQDIRTTIRYEPNTSRTRSVRSKEHNDDEAESEGSKREKQEFNK